MPKEGYPIETVRITNFHRSLAPADIAHNLGTLRNMYTSQKQARRIVDELKGRGLIVEEVENHV